MHNPNQNNPPLTRLAALFYAFTHTPQAFCAHKKIIGLSLVPPFLVLLLAVIINVLRGITIGYLTRDPNAIGGNTYYAGFISQLGIFFWAGTAAICGFTYLLLKQTKAVSEKIAFIIFAGGLTLLLGFDDVFQLHEGFFPAMGVSENIVLASYVVLLAIFLVRFQTVILRTNYVLFAIALGFFGISMVVDVLFLFESIRHLLEDGAKLFGIVTWFAYFAEVCFIALQIHTLDNAKALGSQ